MTKSDGFLSLITLSEKRKDILFFLQGGPHTLADIKDHVNVKTSPEIIPRLKELEASGLITKDADRIYKLTELGNLVLKDLKPLLETVSSLDANTPFWIEHDLSVIPEPLLDRIKELKECKTITENQGHIYDSHATFIKNILSSKSIKGITSIFLPSWITIFLEMARSKVPISLIVTDGVFDIIKSKYASELEEGLKYNNAKMYVIPHINIAFSTTDKFFSLSLYSKDGTYDTRNDLIGFDSSSIKWGDDLFEHFKENAVEIKGIPSPNEHIFINKEEVETIIPGMNLQSFLSR